MATPAAEPVPPWIVCAGARLFADPSGALVWPERDVLVVADLHFEKGSSFARQGRLLPPYDTRATLERLAAVIARHRPRRVISLGDGFHDADASGRLPADDRAHLRRLIAACDWVWVLGNHDPAPPDGLGGAIEAGVEIDRIAFRHMPDGREDRPEIAGHLHPAARIRVRGRGVRRPCFVSDEARIILPAFGSFTGGLDVGHPAIAGLFAGPPEIRMLGRDHVHRIAWPAPQRKRGGPGAASK